TQSGLYVPQDHDRRFRGWVSVRMALGSSLNVPAVRTVGMVGVNRFAAQLKRLGFALPRPGEHYGYSLALGSAETTLLQLGNAFRTLANGGSHGPVRMALDAKTAKTTQALDPRAVFIVSHILSDNNARLSTFGNNNILQTRFWSAVKTGTSKDMRDNWAVGYSQHYTVAVWVGNAQGQAMWDVVGTTGAAPVWAAIMHHLHQNLPSRAPQAPPGLIRERVHFAAPAASKKTGGTWESTVEPDRFEWFIRGTQQGDFSRSAAPKTVALRIDSPVDGTIIALDPDIPPRNQRLLLRTNLPNAQWRINGKAVGQGKTVGWLPWPGKHRISLHTAHGRMVDEVGIEVRGASVKPPAPARQPAGKHEK
ncbi:MAG: penicillin-binding transpeptidase domain-containing protein, partial [Brachymonas sp.]|nr:penicillin-binding transpeptidase domain-containing protein [Brachymonas sp.]